MVDCIQHNSIQCDNQGTASRWWRHQMETFSTLLPICVGNSPVIGDFPAQRPVTRSFDVFFDLRLNKWLSNQWWGWWFEMPSRPLWRHCNVTMITTWDGNEMAFQMAGPVQGKSTGHCGFPSKGILRFGLLIFCLILVWTNCWTNSSVAHCSRSQDIDLFKFQLSYCYNPFQDTCPITSAVLGHLVRTHVPLIFLDRDKTSYWLSGKCGTLKQLSYWWFAITWHLCDVKVIQTHMRHPISRPCEWAMGCLLWVFWKNLTYYNGTELNNFYT